MARVVPIHVLKEYMGHSKIDTTQAFYLAADTRDADVARETLSDFLTPGETEQSRRTSDALPESEPEDADDKNDKALQTQGLSSEADGTRTRNHRIDSLNPVVQPPPSEGAKPPSEGQEPGSVGTGWVPVEGGFGGGLDALLDALDRADGGQSIPAAEAILYCLCTACNAKGFSRVIPQECPRCGAT
ncbi:MAG: hypothetical protein KDA90_24120, partial [Planctomycetaceae bacterium]|nr:hypothetical protein [Planctomycetaceae bacterium]